jgi:hypothetical protein
MRFEAVCGDLGAFIAPISYPTMLTAAAAVIAECLGGSKTTPVCGALIEASPFGFSPGFTPKAGDFVTVSAETSGSTGIRVTFNDRTQGHSATDGSSQTPASGLVALDGVVGVRGNTSSGWLPVPNFSRVIYTHGTINGVTVGAANASVLDMKSGKDIQIHTGPLSVSGNVWTEIFKAST